MGAPRGARPPSHVAYYVALAGILGLLILLCFYFFYYFIRKVKELSSQESPSPTPTAPRAPAAPASYPVQPVVREGATAMAKLCKQLPTQGGKGDTVFPTSTSPAAHQGDMGAGGGAGDVTAGAGEGAAVEEKLGPVPSSGAVEALTVR
ncbi:uncharacterized protein LOC114240167 [Bombyx mandarina]|uniref:Uncharacterized protein LOC114240167 n=1 Tax=Bombyx mandarina TaxID=7092 RepID=A0A6J2JAB0_BOMMA|nr:uncharacterized protein LOC114240167 [Bombyx mandarina]XP_028026426.1 uncharacterized protein LOC114240167 [Bombyx mandarina]